METNQFETNEVLDILFISIVSVILMCFILFVFFRFAREKIVEKELEKAAIKLDSQKKYCRLPLKLRSENANVLLRICMMLLVQN